MEYTTNRKLKSLDKGAIEPHDTGSWPYGKYIGARSDILSFLGIGSLVDWLNPTSVSL
jgi:hypothetical protein